MRTKEFRSENLVPVVRDGAIASPTMGEGRLIPVLVIDCAKRIDLRDLIYAHESLPPGDVKVTWGGRSKRPDSVLLMLEFERPGKLEAIFEFDVMRQGGLVDGILHAHGVYLQPTESGNRVIEGIDKGKILVEIPDTGFLPYWNSLYGEAVVKFYRKQGFSKKQARTAMEEHLKRLRELWSRRMGL